MRQLLFQRPVLNVVPAGRGFVVGAEDQDGNQQKGSGRDNSGRGQLARGMLDCSMSRS